MALCHICENKAYVTCINCEQHTCEDCLTEFTIHNQVDYNLCFVCNDEELKEYAELAYIEELRNLLIDSLGPDEYLKHIQKEMHLRKLFNEINKQLNNDKD